MPVTLPATRLCSKFARTGLYSLHVTTDLNQSHYALSTVQPSPSPPDTFYVQLGKRAFDLVGGCIGLVLTAPIQAIVAVLVRTKLGSPVIFRQQRPGLNSKPFELIKFRTMTDDCGPDGAFLPDVDRLTPFGRFLRSTSLDELPELINVIRGDMSLVGPRPLLMRYLPRYSPRQARRHAVRPGITGLAQVRGRNNVEWEHKFDLDIRYVETLSFIGDLEIMALTAIKVLHRADTSSAGHATSTEYKGSVYR